MWYELDIDLASLNDPECRELIAQGQPLIIVRWNGMLRIYRNLCPHLGISLNFMPDEFFDLGREYLMCANHGALFQVEDGLCVHGPCTRESLPAIPFQVRGDRLFVQLE